MTGTDDFIFERLDELNLISAGWHYMQQTMSPEDRRGFEKMINMPGFSVEKFEHDFLANKINPFDSTESSNTNEKITALVELKDQVKTYFQTYEDRFDNIVDYLMCVSETPVIPKVVKPNVVKDDAVREPDSVKVNTNRKPDVSKMNKLEEPDVSKVNEHREPSVSEMCGHTDPNVVKMGTARQPNVLKVDSTKEPSAASVDTGRKYNDVNLNNARKPNTPKVEKLRPIVTETDAAKEPNVSEMFPRLTKPDVLEVDTLKQSSVENQLEEPRKPSYANTVKKHIPDTGSRIVHGKATSPRTELAVNAGTIIPKAPRSTIQLVYKKPRANGTVRESTGKPSVKTERPKAETVTSNPETPSLLSPITENDLVAMDHSRSSETPDSSMTFDISEPHGKQRKPDNPELWTGRDKRRYRKEKQKAEAMAKELLTVTESQVENQPEDKPANNSPTGKEKRRLKDKLRKEKKAVELQQCNSIAERSVVIPDEQYVAVIQPVVKSDPVMMDQPVMKNEPVVENEPVMMNQPLMKDKPVVENELVVETQTTVEDQPTMENQPTVEIQTVVENQPAVESQPVTEIQIVVENQPVVESEPAELSEPVKEAAEAIETNPKEITTAALDNDEPVQEVPTNEQITLPNELMPTADAVTATSPAAPSQTLEIFKYKAVNKKNGKSKRGSAQKKTKLVMDNTKTSHTVDLIPGEYQIVKVDRNDAAENASAPVNKNSKKSVQRRRNCKVSSTSPNCFIPDDISKNVLDTGKWLAYVIDDKDPQNPKIGEFCTDEVADTIAHCEEIQRKHEERQVAADLARLMNSPYSRLNVPDTNVAEVPQKNAESVRKILAQTKLDNFVEPIPRVIDVTDDDEESVDDLTAFLKSESSEIVAFRTEFAQRTAPLFATNVHFKEFCSKYANSKYTSAQIGKLVSSYIDKRIVFHYEMFEMRGDQESCRIAKSWTFVNECTPYALMIMLYLNSPTPTVHYYQLEKTLFPHPTPLQLN